MAIALAVCFLIGFGGQIWRASQSPHSPIEHNTAAQKNHSANTHAQKEGNEAAIARYTWWLTLFTGIMALATIGLGLATVGLYFAGERQLRLAKETADRQAREIQDQLAVAREAAGAAKLNTDALIKSERPHLIAVKIKFEGLYEANDEIENKKIELTIKNCGRGPAFIKNIGANLLAVDELPPKPGYRWEARISVIPPDTSIPVHLYFSYLTFTAAQKSAILNGKQQLFFSGFVEYSDIFDVTPHHSCFAYVFDHSLNRADGWVPTLPIAYWEYT